MAIDQEAAAVAPDEFARAATRRKAWFIAGLLFLLMVVNYADKAIVGFAGTDISKELGLTSEQFGVVQSSFFWLFAVGGILGGWLGAKIPARWLIGGVMTLWVVSLVPMIGTVGLGMLIASRVLLGFAEGPATALAMRTLHTWFPAHKRAIPSSVLIAGAGIGPVIAAPTLTAIIANHSWHTAFGVLAAVGAIVTVLWLFTGTTGPAATETDGPGEGRPLPVLPDRVPLRRLFRTGTVLGLLALFFVAYWNTTTKVSWLPLYLEEALGYEKTVAGRLIALPYLFAAIAVVVAGVVSRRMTARGASGRASRGLLPAGLVLAGSLATAAFPLMDRGAPQIAMIVLSSTLNSAGYGVAFAGLSDVVPARQRGTVFGIFTAVYSMGGVIAPIVTGALVGGAATKAIGYGHGFLLIGVLMAVGSIVAILFVNPERDAAKLANQG